MLVTKQPDSFTFAVDEVTPAKNLLVTCKPKAAIEALLYARPGLFAADESSQGNPTHSRVEACWNYSLDCVAEIGTHPLIAAAHLAFSEHRPLVLSPDVIWVTIAQGVAQHVRLDSETHRRLFVQHQGKRQLTVYHNDLHHGSPENAWDEVVAGLASQACRTVGKIAQQFICDFSTTGRVERTVSEVVLLDALQPYFSYRVVCVCGIPSVTLEGTVDDWRRLRDKVELLAPMRLNWWLTHLRSICDHFVRAAAGDVDLEHWQRIYKLRHAYGATLINGWLGKLFPYTKDISTGQYSCRNELLDPKVEREILKLEAQEAAGNQVGLFSGHGIESSTLPRGISQVPFQFESNHGRKVAMEFLAGALVVTQDSATRALRPTLGWAVREGAPIEQALARLAEHRTKPARVGDVGESLEGCRMEYVPTDAIRFFHVLQEAWINSPDGDAVYHILPLAKWERCEPRPATNDDYRLPWRYCFAKLHDGTELLVQLACRDDQPLGAIFVGECRGNAAPETGAMVARSFTDFLLQALDGGTVPYFQRDGYVPLA